MMPHQVMISHATSDRALAEILATLIRRCSLGQIDAWFASDLSGAGGMQAGGRWIDEIRNRLNSAKSVIALLTPSSVLRPWLYFEAGFGAAVAELEVIPVIIGLRAVSDVPFPLAMYQAYEMRDIASATLFLRKIFGRFGVMFDEDMSEGPIRDGVSRIAEVRASAADDPSADGPSEERPLLDVNRLINYIDRRFIELQRAFLTKSEPPGDYSIHVVLDDKHGSEVMLPILGHQSVQHVLDAIYFLMSKRVDPFTYLEQWILFEASTGTHLVIKEIQKRVPANCIFEPGSVWKVRRLTKPYSASESGARTRGAS